MSERLFGTDGVRGIANEELSPELALRLGLAAGYLLNKQQAQSQGKERTVVVGFDSRISSPMLEAALLAGLCSMGITAISGGLLPTPAVARITQELGADAGVVISASHNPFQDNGIKFFGATGHKLADSLEAELENLVPRAFDLPRPTGAGIGHMRRDPSLRDLYAGHIESSVYGLQLDGLKVVVDGGNGAASQLGPKVFADLGADVIAMNCTPDGININDHSGALHASGMALRVAAEHADAGMAFDGDADRVIMADNLGRRVDGDRIMAICGLALAERSELAGRTIVGTVMSNMGLEAALKPHGISLERTDVGDRNVSERMREGGFVIGGEKSGHIIFGALTTTGDGILTALQVLRVMKDSGRTLAELSDVMSDYPQTLVNIRVTDRTGWQSDSSVQSAIKTAQSKLEGRGRINVRASGTEKLIRVMVEAPDSATVNSVADSIAGIIRERWGDSSQ